MLLASTPTKETTVQYASEPRKRFSRANAITVVTGLSAWLAGVGFCVGLGITAPVWVAAIVTVLSIALSRLGAQAKRR